MSSNTPNSANKPLDARTCSTIKQSSITNTAGFLRDLVPTFRMGYFLGKNHYVKDTTDKVKVIATAPLCTKQRAHKGRNRDLCNYISLSSILHCYDGWTLFGNALSALMHGKYSTAIHLAYYAELRASMSILASHGIGVFNDRHVAINSTKTIENIIEEKKTHTITWKLLSCWAEHHSIVILENLRFSGKDLRSRLEDTVPHFSRAPAINPVIELRMQRLLENWFRWLPFDSEIFRKDHNMRNTASYRPDFKIAKTGRLTSKMVYNFVGDVWDLSEPGFQALGLLFFRKVFRSFHRQRAREKAVARLNLDEETNLFLLKKGTEESIFDLATKPCRDGEEKNALRMLSRAFLLLSISVALNHKLIREAGVTKAELEFFLSDEGQKNGLWKTYSDFEDFSDLWSDPKDAVMELRTLFHTTNDPTNYDILHTESVNLPSLCSNELMFMWGLFCGR